MSKTATILVGLPATGKSTYVLTRPNAFVLSFDRLLMAMGKVYGITEYQKCWKTFVSTIDDKKLLNALMTESLNYDEVVVDRTNLTIAKRKPIIDFYNDNGYYVDCVIFEPSDELHHKMIDGRPDKIIPDFVMGDMIAEYEEPTMDEGFCSVIYREYVTK